MGTITSGSSGVLDGGAGVARMGDSIQVTASEMAAALGSPAGNPNNTHRNIDGTTSNPFFNPDGTLKPGIPGTAMIGVNAAPAPGLSNNHVTLQHLINVTGSAGLTRGGTLTAAVDGVSVDGGIVLMRTEDDDEAQLNFYDFDDVTLHANNFPAETNHIGLVWNSSGKPTVEVRASYNWNKNTEAPLGTVSNLGGALEVLNAPHRLNNAVTNIIERFDATAPATRDASVGGLLLSESSGRLINVTAGKIWARLNDFDHGNKTGTPIVHTYSNGSDLVFNTSSQWDNLRYNNTVAGTLVVMDNAKFATLWFFMHAESGTVFAVYGTTQHSSAYKASLELMPEHLPQEFKNQTVFLGRLVFLKNEPSAATIDSPFDGYVHTTLSGGGDTPSITDTDSVPEGGTNLYFTAIRARNAVVVQTITNGDTTHSPSADVVFDALALKANTSHVHSAADITSGVFPDARLSANVALKNALNTFTANNTFASGRTLFGSGWSVAIEAATANGAAPRIQSNTQPLYLNELGNAVIIGAGGLQVGTSISVNGNAVWHIGNDGAGSGLDADLLDGQQGSYYLNATNLNAGTVATARLGSGTANTATYLRGDGAWVPIPPADLTSSANSTVVQIDSASGTDVTILSANNTTAGVMAAADYSRLANTSGTNTGDQTTITGNAGSATVLQTARTIAISGVATGTATSFNGSANITIPVTAINLGSANNTGTVAVARGGTGVTTSTGSNNNVLSHSPTFTGSVVLPAATFSTGLYAVVTGVMAQKAGTMTTAAVTQVALDTYDATYRSAKYIVQVVDTVSGHAEITEVLITVDNSNNVFVTEFGINYTGAGALATFTADYSAPNKRLLVTPASANSTQFKFSATLFAT